MKSNPKFWAIFRRRLVFSVLLFIAVFVVIHFVIPYVRPPQGEVTLAELGARQLVRLRKNIDAGSVYHLKIRVRGHLNGEAMIRLFEEENEEKIYREKMIGPEKVDVIFLDGAWYSDSARIEYAPLNADQGSLQIEYAFKTSGKKK